MRTLTIAEAAATSGLSEKALRRRIERGTLPAVTGHDGRRRIPVDALTDARAGHALGHAPRPGSPPGHGDLGVLIQRLEELAAENGRLRALEQQTGSLTDQLQRDLFEARARIAELEARRGAARRWWRRQ